MRTCLPLLLTCLCSSLPGAAPLPPVGSQVFVWEDQVEQAESARRFRTLVEGQTRDLEYFEIHATTLALGGSPHPPHTHTETEEIVILREGTVEVTLDGEKEELGPGSILTLLPGEAHTVHAVGAVPPTYYVLTFRARERVRAAADPRARSFLVEGNAPVYEPRPEGGRWDYCDRATQHFSRFEVHRSILEPDAPDQPVQSWRAEQAVLVLRGAIELELGGQWQRAGAGDLVFVDAEAAPRLRNLGNTPAEFFTIRWQ